MRTTIEVPTPEPPGWVAQDEVLNHLWQSSLTWRIEMLRADESIDRESEIERVARLAHEHDLAKATITVAEAERRWRKTNLRQNARGRLAMWQDGPAGSQWLTTVDAMRAVFGDEPK